MVPTHNTIILTVELSESTQTGYLSDDNKWLNGTPVHNQCVSTINEHPVTRKWLQLTKVTASP